MRLSSIILLPSLFASTLLSGCGGWGEQGIKDELARANRCETADDCAWIGSKCPFGCEIYVHRDEAAAMKALVDGFDAQCVYGCMQTFGVECKDRRCEPVLQEPLTEGNPGAACDTHDDCITPARFLLRSNCPFDMRCIEDACAVVCPVDFGSNRQDKRCEADADCDCSEYAGDDKEGCRCVDNACVAVMETD